MKIYEAMAAGVPVVSTPVGAEGLTVRDGVNIRLTDDPAAFASRCLDLLNDGDRARSQAAAALDLVTSEFSWNKIAGAFEDILRRAQ